MLNKKMLLLALATVSLSLTTKVAASSGEQPATVKSTTWYQPSHYSHGQKAATGAAFFTAGIVALLTNHLTASEEKAMVIKFFSTDVNGVTWTARLKANQNGERVLFAKICAIASALVVGGGVAIHQGLKWKKASKGL